MQSYTPSNQLSGWNCDAAGNLLQDGLGNTYQYDAEGKITSAAGATYIYGADGQRVEKANPTKTDTVYFNGKPIGFYSGSAWTDFVYGPTGLLLETPGTQAGTATYRMTDHLGSLVGTLNASGGVQSTEDIAPFGEVFAGSSTDGFIFTGKQRDIETSNDYFGARYYANSMGRFMSPDWSEGEQPIPYADPANPQSLNLYAYVNNNPLSNTDEDGHSCDQGSTGPDGVFTFKCQNDPTLLDEFMQQIRTDPNQQRTLIAQKGLTLPNGHPLDAGVLSGMSDDAVNSLAHQLAAQQYAQIMSALSSIPFKSSWGWNNSPAYMKARNELKTPGDHPDLNGKVPTREEANQMIQEAGGSVDRNDPGHAPGGVSTHTDPHVNYTTPSGDKATVTVREH